MDAGLKQRLVGALVLIGLAIIFLPALFDGTAQSPELDPVVIPERPKFEVISPLVKDSEQHKQAVEEQIASDREQYLAEEKAVEETPAEEESQPEEPATTPEPQAESALASKQTETETEEAAPKPDNNLSQGLIKVWTIQLGSFSKEENAVQLKDKLVKDNYRAYTETHQTENGDVTRVFVGPDLKKNKAEELLTALKDQYQLEGMIVRYEP